VLRSGRDRPYEGERVDSRGDGEVMRLPQGFIVELLEPWAVTVALERTVQALDALWLPLDGTAARYLAFAAKGLTARRLENIAMGRGRGHSHVQRGDGE